MLGIYKDLLLVKYIYRQMNTFKLENLILKYWNVYNTEDMEYLLGF